MPDMLLNSITHQFGLFITFSVLTQGTCNVCGTIGTLKPTILGGNVTLYFKPSYPNLNGFVYWYMCYEYATNSCSWKEITNTSGRHVIRKLEQQYYLYILTSTTSDGTLYYVNYYQGSIYWCSSLNFKLALVVMSMMPMIFPTKDIENCIGCIVVEMDRMTEIYCNTSGGTPPINTYISINGISQTISYNGSVVEVRKKLGKEHHRTNVTCVIQHDALEYPLNVTAQIYVMVKPENLTWLHSNYEDPSSGYKCISYGGRPAPKHNLSITGYNGSVSFTSLASKSDDELYTVTSTLVETRLEWDTKSIKCCLQHELITSTCTNETTIKYSNIAQLHKEPEFSRKAYVWAIIGVAAALVLLAGTIAVIVKTKRCKVGHGSDGKQTARSQCSKSSGNNAIEPTDFNEDNYAEINTTIHSVPDKVKSNDGVNGVKKFTKDEQPVKMNEALDDTSSVVNKCKNLSDKQKLDKLVTERTQLVYALLDHNHAANVNCTNEQPALQQSDVQLEYADIDFAKTAQSIDDKENTNESSVYANCGTREI